MIQMLFSPNSTGPDFRKVGKSPSRIESWTVVIWVGVYQLSFNNSIVATSTGQFHLLDMVLLFFYFNHIQFLGQRAAFTHTFFSKKIKTSAYFIIKNLVIKGCVFKKRMPKFTCSSRQSPNSIGHKNYRHL